MFFSPIIEESLKQYVDSKIQKEKFLKKKDCCYIEDIIRKKKKKKNEILDIKNLEQNMTKIEEKDNYEFKLDFDENPFKNILIDGGLATGAIINGSLFIGLGVSSTLVGFAVSGIGLIIAIPGFIGLGIFGIVSRVKDYNRKKFYKDFKSDKMKVEREVQEYALEVIEKYFNEYISIENQETKLKFDECEKYINNIIDIYIEKDNNNLNSILLELDQKHILDKLKNDCKIILNNISKIRKEIFKTILSCSSNDLKDIFNSGVPLFKEFIKIFGPSNIDKKTEKKIDENIAKILLIMKDILDKNINKALEEFKLKTYINYFEDYLSEKYEDKKKNDNIIKEEDFTDNCKYYIIEPIGKNAKYYGILFLFKIFTIIIQNIGSKKKVQNYEQNKENIRKKILLANNLNFNKKQL